MNGGVIGLIGHLTTECGDGVHMPEECEWGDWLHVNYDNNTDFGGTSSRGRGCGAGFPGRGDGFGRGRGNPDEPNKEEGRDIDLSAANVLGASATAPGARKCLVGPDGTLLKEVASQELNSDVVAE